VIAEVRLWGPTIGAVSMADGRDHAAFQFTPEFGGSGIQVSPIVMPLSVQTCEFPGLPRHVLRASRDVADSLPDRFGNALIDAWLATQIRSPGTFTAIERLCYTGSRGMCALESAAVVCPKPPRAAKVDVDALVKLAFEVLTTATTSPDISRNRR